MSLGGGGDRSWLEPVDNQGNRSSDVEGTIGCHSGNTEALNIDYSEPGFMYLWGRNTQADIRANMRNGYVIVGPDDPEMASMKRLGSINQSTLDTSQIYGDVILMKAPAERVRKLRETEQERARAMLRSGSDEFLGKVTQAERMLDPRHRDTRFYTAREHNIQVVDERSNQVLDEWIPERGILK
jgi:hypothetical protein